MGTFRAKEFAHQIMSSVTHVPSFGILEYSVENDFMVGQSTHKLDKGITHFKIKGIGQLGETMIESTSTKEASTTFDTNKQGGVTCNFIEEAEE